MKDARKTLRHALLMPLTVIVLGAGSFAAAQTASTSYKGARQDPFTKFKPPIKRVAVKNVTMPLAPPPVNSRIDGYKAQKLAAMNLRQPVPKPTTAILLSEIVVTGIFRTPRGVAATVEATPIRLSYVVYPGEVFYDGMLVAIEENQLIFRREIRWSDGRRDIAVETKALRQPNAYTDSMTAQKSEPEAAGRVEGANVQATSPATSDAKGAGSDANMKAVESLNSKVEKLLDLLKKQQ